MCESYFVGVDVGTRSVRAGLVAPDGRVVKSLSRDIQIWRPGPDMYEQSSQDVWHNLCIAVKHVTSGVEDKKLIKGLGFDATCSLVVVGPTGKPVTVSPSKDPQRNIVMWLDHRAVDQAKRINESNHKVLKYVGGVLSPEMQAAKLLWLKENLKTECWDKAGLFLDLPEYLCYVATGVPVRSTCSVVCKFNFMRHVSQREKGVTSGWVDSFWTGIGLEDFVQENYSRLGHAISESGCAIGQGLTKQAAEQMGLWEGMSVSCSLIDAHAGGLGVIGADVKGSELPCENFPLTSRLAVICGTSTCHMAISEEPVFVDGVWGPYFSAMVPGLWLNEGGQSIAGKLNAFTTVIISHCYGQVDHIIESHPAYGELQNEAETRSCNIYEHLNTRAETLAERRELRQAAYLTRDVHVFPDFHGNRSPVADPTLKGMISGLTLASDVDSLVVLYLATLQALAHGTRHIVESMNSAGHHINTLFVCGGLIKNKMFIRVHADVTGFPVVLPRESEPVLVGSAILGACAAGHYPSIQDAMSNMSAVGQVVMPQEELASYYEKKHRVFLKMLEDQIAYREIMKGTGR